MTRVRRPTRSRVLGAAFGVFIVAVLVISWLTRDVLAEPPVVDGALWHAEHRGAPLLLYVTREERARRVPIPGRSRGWERQPYTRFTLAVRSVPDGALLHTLPLGDLRVVHATRSPRIVGVVGGIAWIWRDGLEARFLPDLELHATAATLARRRGDGDRAERASRHRAGIGKLSPRRARRARRRATAEPRLDHGGHGEHGGRGRTRGGITHQRRDLDHQGLE